MSNPIADPFVEGRDTDSESSLVLVDATVGGAATVTINRAARKNAFNAEVIGALREAFETLAGADGVRVVFVTGAGGTFSAGADLTWMADAADYTEIGQSRRRHGDGRDAGSICTTFRPSPWRWSKGRPSAAERGLRRPATWPSPRPAPSLPFRK